MLEQKFELFIGGAFVVVLMSRSREVAEPSPSELHSLDALSGDM